MLENISIQAKRAVLEPGVEIDNAVIQIQHGVIVSVAKSNVPSAQTVDLGDVTLAPGFVNAHTHLEFSDLDNPLGQPEMPFVDWLQLVISQRFSESQSEQSKRLAICDGLSQSAGFGTAALGEIGTSTLVPDQYVQENIDVTLFFERLTRNPELVDSVGKECEDWLDESKSEERSAIKAISPHAPYSVHPQLFKQLVQHSIKFRCPIAIHLAETQAELQLLKSKDGPFVEFMKSLSAWFPDTYTTGTRIMDYLELLATVPLSLVVHGNYLNDQEISFVAGNETMWVVFCPRTHDYFRHSEYPLEKLISADVNLAIGTDSRASNPDLSLFEELKMIKQKWPGLSDMQLLKMSTNSKPLGRAEDLTWIKVGNCARLNVLEQIDNGLFSSESRCTPLAKWI